MSLRLVRAMRPSSLMEMHYKASILDVLDCLGFRKNADARKIEGCSRSLRSPFEQRPQLVTGHAVNVEGGARVRDLAEQQFGAAISVSIHRVNQFHAWDRIQMLRVGDVRKQLAQLAINI